MEHTPTHSPHFRDVLYRVHCTENRVVSLVSLSQSQSFLAQKAPFGCMISSRIITLKQSILNLLIDANYGINCPTI